MVSDTHGVEAGRFGGLSHRDDALACGVRAPLRHMDAKLHDARLRSRLVRLLPTYSPSVMWRNGGPSSISSMTWAMRPGSTDSTASAVVCAYDSPTSLHTAASAPS